MSYLNTEPPSLSSKLQQKHCSVSVPILYAFLVFRSLLHVLETFLNIKWDLTHNHSTFVDLGLYHLIFYRKLSTKLLWKICTAFIEDFKFLGCICRVLNTKWSESKLPLAYFSSKFSCFHTHNGCGMFVLCILESAKNQLSLLHQSVRWYRLMNLHTKTY